MKNPRLYNVVVIFLIIVSIIAVADEITRLYSDPGSAAITLGSRAAATAQTITSFNGIRWNSLVTLGSAAPAIAKITVAHGKHNDGYEQALRTHLSHADLHEYPMFLLDHRLVDGLWNKEAALLDVVLDQLTKPKGQRLEWLMWVDADTLVMNKQIPLEIFLPPSTFHKEVNLLYTKDWNGLNNGVFFLRISPWAMEFLSSVLAYRTFRPKEKLAFTEQSAMARVMKMDQYRDHAVECPPQWFNAYPSDGGGSAVHYNHLPGQLLVHFAGFADKTTMIKEWVEKLEGNRTHWEMSVEDTNYQQQIAEFWDGLSEEHAAEEKLRVEKEEEKKKEEKKKQMEKEEARTKEEAAVREASEKQRMKGD